MGFNSGFKGLICSINTVPVNYRIAVYKSCPYLGLRFSGNMTPRPQIISSRRFEKHGAFIFRSLELCFPNFFTKNPLNRRPIKIYRPGKVDSGVHNSGTATRLGWLCRLRLKCDVTRVETRFRLSAKRTSPFKSAGASVQSTTGSRGVRISGSNAGYTMF